MLANKNEILHKIDSCIKNVWLTSVANDYKQGYLLREDSLKCSLYYHLRCALAKLFDEEDIRIYAEFHIPNTSKRADLVIAHIDDASEEYYLKDKIDDILAVIEMKYDGGNSIATQNWIKSDIAKLKSYIQDDKLLCQYYLAVIYETKCTSTNWMDHRNIWAKNHVTELNAAKINDEMVFHINAFNSDIFAK